MHKVKLRRLFRGEWSDGYLRAPVPRPVKRRRVDAVLDRLSLDADGLTTSAEYLRRSRGDDK